MPRPQIQPQAARHAGFFPDPVQASLSPASRLPITRGPPRSASLPPSPRVQTTALGPRRPGPRRGWEPPLPLDTAGPAPHLCFTALRAFSCCRVTLGWFLVEERRTEAPGEQVSFHARLGLCQRLAPGEEATLTARTPMWRMARRKERDELTGPVAGLFFFKQRKTTKMKWNLKLF